MTIGEIIAFVSSLPGVATVTASEANGAPEAAWGVLTLANRSGPPRPAPAGLA